MNKPTPQQYDALYASLPAWMRPRRRTVDWGLVIVLAFCMLVVWPLLARRELPHGTDAELYLFRSLEIARIIHGGSLFSRWAPDFNYGLGSPLFNYLAPLPHYLPGYHQAFTDTAPIDSVNLFLAGSIVAAGSGMFLYVRQRWGISASVVGALVYVFSPPIALTLPYFSGDLSLLMALGALPWALWAIDYLWVFPRRRTLVLAAVLVGAFFLCDARIALIGSLVILTGVATLRRLPGFSEHILVAIFAALALTAFFWLPALAERDAIHWIAARANAWAGPVPLSELLGDIPRFVPSGQGNVVYRGFGIGTWAQAVVGAGAIVWKAWRRRALLLDVALYLVIGVTLAVLSTPAFYGLWPSPLNFQPVLPYHALLVAVFCLAVVSAQSVHWLEFVGPRWQMAALTILCLVAPLASLAAVYPPDRSIGENQPSVVTGLQSELRGEHIGSFRDGVLLPEAAPRLPEPLPNLVESFQTDSFDRVNRQFYSAESQINSVERGLFYNRYFFDILQPGEVEFNILYYPGWSASIDGRRPDVQASPEGLLTVRLPKPNGELAIWLEGTPFRYLSWAITLGGAILLFLVARHIRSPMLR